MSIEVVENVNRKCERMNRKNFLDIFVFRKKIYLLFFGAKTIKLGGFFFGESSLTKLIVQFT